MKCGTGTKINKYIKGCNSSQFIGLRGKMENWNIKRFYKKIKKKKSRGRLKTNIQTNF